ncbi:DNA starvation/stationary phase protection protein [Frankia sp. CNm7]|uniref:DNA starvation/stationary phase protection protein n=1 Tax=Frankia nepalensis TaxID=1836974 RepID=A0A937RMH5_9ACTN|nr:DNA starvation/stationary phase protection protein [Frankia nepalensis]MBL7501324.1 DNA starvation/stationary phase protection protein [Frankia nepalensis]MBL7510826.1 DNA starvation/stationary phase protection protein [Frankia nepalensis]MBL7521570.1 DNA starvation/stationary phase protection protein [Frankia nepalensis]MBL7628601.1 DNA starvation/stationary phase protection protein [Frankia nepalensis]
MSTIRSPLAEDARTTTGEALQAALVELIDLSLLAKQLHWNVIGHSFRSVHKQLDQVVDLARRYTDLTAERAVAIGYNPDGQASTVDDRSPLHGVETGYLPDEKVVRVMTDRLSEVSRHMRAHMAATEQADPVTQDLFISLLREVEEQHWMFQAMS